MTFGSLFSGIGGMDLGLERAGMECKWQVEIDPFCQRVLAKHWPGVKRYGDITKLDGSELEPVDVLAGGFPCQDLSHAGKRAGIEGSRSGLWFEFARLIGELRPRFVLIENVPGLLVPGAMSRVVGELARLGYVGFWRCLRASEFGASHLRKRVFIVAYTREGSGAGIHQEARYRWRDPERNGIKLVDSKGSRVGGLPESDGRHDATHVDGSGPELAHAAGRGFGELRESSRRNGLVDGSLTELGDSASPRFSGWQAGTSGQVRDGAWREESVKRRDSVGNSAYELHDEPVERVGKYTCGSCGGTFDAFEYVNRIRPGALGERMLVLGECHWCDGYNGAAYITYDTNHDGTGDPNEPDRPGEDDELADARNGFIQEPWRGPEGRNGAGSASQILPDASRAGLPDAELEGISGSRGRVEGRTASELCGAHLADANGINGDDTGHGAIEVCGERREETKVFRLPQFAPGPSDPRWPTILAERPDLAPALGGRLGPRFVEFLMGFPIGHTEVGYVDAKKDGPDKNVQRLRPSATSQAVQRNAGIHKCISASKILQSELYGDRAYEGRPNPERLPAPDTPSPEIGLRNLRDQREAPNASPQGPELEEQRAVQHSDAVLKLSYLVASCRRGDCSTLRAEAMQALRSPNFEATCLRLLPDEDQQIWESLPDEDRQATITEGIAWAAAMQERTKRLGRLGNAVVPAVAEWIGRRIMESVR